MIGLDTHPSERRDEIDQKLFPYSENGSECSVIALTSYCFEKVTDKFCQIYHFTLDLYSKVACNHITQRQLFFEAFESLNFFCFRFS